MGINKGKVKNISKKVFALGVTFALIPATFSGCTVATSIDGIEYARNEQGYIDGVKGLISIKYLKNSGFYEVTNDITGEKYYAILIYDAFRNCYYDLFTKQNISKGEFTRSDMINSVEDYLIAYEMIKEMYTPEDLQELLNIFIENQDKEKDKQLVKE